MRIGIDVGGTNTDAVLMDGVSVLAWHKAPTTPDVTSGITAVLKAIMAESGDQGKMGAKPPGGALG